MKYRMVSGEEKPHQGSFYFHICPGHIMLCFLIWNFSWEFGEIQQEFEETSESSKQVTQLQILSRGVVVFSVETAGNLSVRLIMPSQARWGQTTGKLLSSLNPSWVSATLAQ